MKESGFRHNVDTYAAFIRVLCRWRFDKKLQSLLSEIVGSKESDLGFDITALFDVLSVNSGVLIWVLDMLVKEYVSVGMFDEAIDALFQLKRQGFVPCIMSCNFLMNRLIEHGKVDIALAIYGHLKMSGLNPNDYTYGILLKTLCRKGNFEEA